MDYRQADVFFGWPEHGGEKYYRKKMSQYAFNENNNFGIRYTEFRILYSENNAG
jgi:hypothetical protein